MKGIHPEFLLQKKGNKFDSLIAQLNTFQDGEIRDIDYQLSKLKLTKKIAKRFRVELDEFDVGKKWTISQDCDASTSKMKNFSRFVEEHQKGRAGIYSVGQLFFDAVSTIDRAIPISKMCKDDIPIFIRTPRRKIAGKFYNGAYIFAHLETNFVYMIFTRDNVEFSMMDSRMLILGQEEGMINLNNIENIIKGKVREDAEQGVTLVFTDMDDPIGGGDYSDYKNYLLGVLNTAVYIHSQDPVIENLEPLRKYGGKVISKMEKSKRENLCTLPVHLVNWNYYMGVKYSVDSTMVNAHMRWQPCGPERSQVKLIWVKEHERRYK